MNSTKIVTVWVNNDKIYGKNNFYFSKKKVQIFANFAKNFLKNHRIQKLILKLKINK